MIHLAVSDCADSAYRNKESVKPFAMHEPREPMAVESGMKTISKRSELGHDGYRER
jgi:hypothetical protein